MRGHMREWLYITYMETILFEYISIYIWTYEEKISLRKHFCDNTPLSESFGNAAKAARIPRLRTPGAVSAAPRRSGRRRRRSVSSASARAAWRTELPWPRSVHKPVPCTALLGRLSFGIVSSLPPPLVVLLFTVLSLLVPSHCILLWPMLIALALSYLFYRLHKCDLILVFITDIILSRIIFIYSILQLLESSSFAPFNTPFPSCPPKPLIAPSSALPPPPDRQPSTWRLLSHTVQVSLSPLLSNICFVNAHGWS